MDSLFRGNSTALTVVEDQDQKPDITYLKNKFGRKIKEQIDLIEIDAKYGNPGSVYRIVPKEQFAHYRTLGPRKTYLYAWGYKPGDKKYYNEISIRPVDVGKFR